MNRNKNANLADSHCKTNTDKPEVIEIVTYGFSLHKRLCRPTC